MESLAFAHLLRPSLKNRPSAIRGWIQTWAFDLPMPSAELSPKLRQLLTAIPSSKPMFAKQWSPAFHIRFTTDAEVN